MSLWQFVLFLHVIVAIIAFGPTFAFGIMASFGSREPLHTGFALRLAEFIEKRLVIPLAVVMPFLGLWLIYLRDWDLWKSEWLIIAIVLYTIAFFVAVFVLDRSLARLIRLTQAAPPPTDPASTAPMPPEIAREVRIQQIGGMFEALAIAAIVLLMVWKPGGALTV